MFVESEILCTVLEKDSNLEKKKKNTPNLFLRTTLNIGVSQPVLISVMEQQC